MPYVKLEQKQSIDAGEPPMTAGELNYKFTKIAMEYVKTRGECYSTFNDILGALDGCAKEFYRRKVVPYEDKKIQENGDVYD